MNIWDMMLIKNSDMTWNVPGLQSDYDRNVMEINRQLLKLRMVFPFPNINVGATGIIKQLY